MRFLHNKKKPKKDPYILGLLSSVKIRLHRFREFHSRRRVLSTSLIVGLLIGLSFALTNHQAHADVVITDGDLLKEFKEAAYHISRDDRGLMESIHYLAWYRWTGFRPTSGTYYLVSAGGAASVATNAISSLFFSVSGLILQAVGLLAAIGLSFEPIDYAIVQVERNMVVVASIFIPGLRSEYERLCSESTGQVCGVLNSGYSALLGAGFLLVVFIGYLLLKAWKLSKKNNRNGSFLPGNLSDTARQITLSVLAVVLLFTMAFGSAEDLKKYVGNAYTAEASVTNAEIGSPRWIAGWIEQGSVFAADAIGFGTNAASTILTGRSVKTGPSIGGACSSYVGALHAVYQHGSSNKSRDQFLIALDELALNSYIRLIVNATMGSVDDSSFGGSGNAWCHRMESDAGITGAEHMLMTRLSLSMEHGSLQSGSTINAPLAYSIDKNIDSIISGGPVQKFAAIQSIKNMWGPYTTPSAHNEMAFYFAVCNTYHPQPKMLKTWGSVVTADAIKGHGAVTWGEGSDAVALPIGGTKESRIYLDGSTTLAEMSKGIMNHNGANGNVDALCAAIPLGSAARDPMVSRSPNAKDFTKYVMAGVSDIANPLVWAGISNSSQSEYSRGVAAGNKLIQTNWNGGYRSFADQTVAKSPDSGVDFNLLGDLSSKLATAQLSDFQLPKVGREVSTKDGKAKVVDPAEFYTAIETFSIETSRDPVVSNALLSMIAASLKDEGSVKTSPETEGWFSWLARGTINTAASLDITGLTAAVRDATIGTKSEQEEVAKVNEELERSKITTEGILKVASEDTDAGVIARAALSGFGQSQASLARSLDWKEPDVEFLGIGISKMSSAAPLFSRAINSGPYDYYLATVSGHPDATLLSAVCSIFLAIAIGWFLLPLVLGIVLSKLLSVLAWMFAGVVLIMNVIPHPPFRTLFKLTIVSILWSQFSTTVFTGILKILTMLIVVFSAILYNPTHPVIVQTFEIMLSIIIAFAIVKHILKNFLQIDFTSFKGAVAGAGIMSGHAVFDAIDKPLGLWKESGEGDDSVDGIKQMFSDLKERVAGRDTDDADKSDTDSSVFDQGGESDENQSSGADSDEVIEAEIIEDEEFDPDAPIIVTAEDTGGEPSDLVLGAAGLPALPPGTSGNAEEEAGNLQVSDEEATNGAKSVFENVYGSAGIDHVDHMESDEKIRENFEAMNPDKVAQETELAIVDEEPDYVTAASSVAETFGGGEDSEDVGTGIEVEDGKLVPIQDTYTQAPGNDSMTHNNKFTEALNSEGAGGIYTDQEREDLQHASAISEELNANSDVGSLDALSEQDRQWIEERDQYLVDLLNRANVDPVNISDAGVAPGLSPADNSESVNLDRSANDSLEALDGYMKSGVREFTDTGLDDDNATMGNAHPNAGNSKPADDMADLTRTDVPDSHVNDQLVDRSSSMSQDLKVVGNDNNDQADPFATDDGFSLGHQDYEQPQKVEDDWSKNDSHEEILESIDAGIRSLVDYAEGEAKDREEEKFRRGLY